MRAGMSGSACLLQILFKLVESAAKALPHGSVHAREECELRFGGIARTAAKRQRSLSIGLFECQRVVNFEWEFRGERRACDAAALVGKGIREHQCFGRDDLSVEKASPHG